MNTAIQNAIRIALEHHQTGHLSQAEAMYRQILQVAPNNPDALHFLGVIAYQTGKNDLAAELIGKAVLIKPTGLIYCNLGLALHALGKFDAAIENFNHAISLEPGDAISHHSLGLSLQAQTKLDAAIESYRKALMLKPDYVEAHLNLGNALKDAGNKDEAASCYRHALSLNPNYVEAHNNLGTMLKEQGNLDAAIECYHKALSLQPDCAMAHYNLGNIYKEQCKIDKAAESYQRALSFNPDFALAYSNLLYLHAFTRDVSPEAERDLAANWENVILSEADRMAARKRALSAEEAFHRDPRTGRKLRLGIVSAELGQHAVAEFLEPFMENLDRSRFHLILYPSVVRQGARADRFRDIADEYKPLADIPDKDAADLIRSDRVDILMDTTGHMNGFRLGIFAHRAAPVQCHYIGYHGTTGLTEMDWYIADNTLLPAGYEAHFREGIWRLPRLRLAYRGDTSLPNSNWQPSPDGIIWLGSFNNLIKVREQALGLWAKIMNALPESRLLLKDSSAANPAVQKRIRDELTRHGISGERVEFVSWVPDWKQHMALYDRLDIALDTIPLNSETTAFDALWMGVPLIALEGNWIGGRQASTILKALGKPEWVARNENEYVEIVTTLARNVEGRKALRTNQRSLVAASQLCDAKGLAKSLEAAFEEMYDRWLAKCKAS